jgi:hypothetical protein
MKKKYRSKLVHEGDLIAEVNVNLIETGEGWTPYISIEDAYKLDDVRDALRKGDIETASKFGRVFKMTPITIPSQKENNMLDQSGR